MFVQLCSNCKWEVSALFDKHDKIFRCSDCGSEIEGHEEDQEENKYVKNNHVC